MVHSHENKRDAFFFSNKTIKEKKTVWGRGLLQTKKMCLEKKLKKKKMSVNLRLQSKMETKC